MAEEMIQAELGESAEGPVTLTGCYDRAEPELCFHKASLCTDPHHKDKIRHDCPATCGVCKAGERIPQPYSHIFNDLIHH